MIFFQSSVFAVGYNLRKVHSSKNKKLRSIFPQKWPPSRRKCANYGYFGHFNENDHFENRFFGQIEPQISRKCNFWLVPAALDKKKCPYDPIYCGNSEEHIKKKLKMHFWAIFRIHEETDFFQYSGLFGPFTPVKVSFAAF